MRDKALLPNTGAPQELIIQNARDPRRMKRMERGEGGGEREGVKMRLI